MVTPVIVLATQSSSKINPSNPRDASPSGSFIREQSAISTKIVLALKKKRTRSEPIPHQSFGAQPQQIRVLEHSDTYMGALSQRYDVLETTVAATSTSFGPAAED